MKTIHFKLTSLLLMLLLGVGTASASFTVQVGRATLTLEENSNSSTVTLVKCECGRWSSGQFYWEEMVVIPDEVTVNGVTKTVTQIGSSQNNPVFYDMVEVVFPSTTKVIKKSGFTDRSSQGAPGYHGLKERCFNLEKVENLVSLETDFSIYHNHGDIPYVKGLTIGNDVQLKDDFPFEKAVNLTYDEGSTVYDCIGGCLMKKGDNETVVTILRVPEVTVPATVKRIAHSMPLYNDEEKTHITFEAGSQLTTINGSLNCCVFDEWPSTVTTVDWPWASKGFTGSEFLTFVLPANHVSFKSNPFAGAIFHQFEWGENPTLKPYLFSNCTFTEDLAVPDGITMTLGALRRANFKGNLVLPETLESLVWSEFSYCTFSKELILPDNIAKLPSSCFEGTRFGGGVHLPENATVMGDSCFYDCEFDARLTMPDGISELPQYAFYGCRFKGLDLPAAVKTIPAGVFQNAKFMSSLTLPDGLEMIAKNAFANVEFNNTTLIMPAGVAVDKDAFVGCQIYKMVWQGDTFNGLGSMPPGEQFSDWRFQNCRYTISILDLGTSAPTEHALTYFPRNGMIYTHCKTPPAVTSLIWQQGPIETDHLGTLYVPRGSKEIYENTYPWGYFQNIVEFDETQQMPFIGDVNGDGKVNVSDITTLVNNILTGNEENALNDDVNEDSQVNVSDVTTGVNKILGVK